VLYTLFTVDHDTFYVGNLFHVFFCKLSTVECIHYSSPIDEIFFSSSLFQNARILGLYHIIDRIYNKGLERTQSKKYVNNNETPIDAYGSVMSMYCEEENKERRGNATLETLKTLETHYVFFFYALGISPGRKTS
jgi:hypothetical protein